LWVGIAAAILYDRAGFSSLAFAAAALATLVAVTATFLPIRSADIDDKEDREPEDADDAITESEGDTYAAAQLAGVAINPVEERRAATILRRRVLLGYREPTVDAFVYAYASKRFERPSFAQGCVEIIERLEAGPEGRTHEFVLTADGRFIIRPHGKSSLPSRPESPRLPHVEDDEQTTPLLH